MFPEAHPSLRQSRVDITQHPAVTAVQEAVRDLLEECRDPSRVTRAHARRQVLAPGELLVLPAGWMHHVEALDLSVSVNLWVRPAWTRVIRGRF